MTLCDFKSHDFAYGQGTWVSCPGQENAQVLAWMGGCLVFISTSQVHTILHGIAAGSRTQGSVMYNTYLVGTLPNTSLRKESPSAQIQRQACTESEMAESGMMINSVCWTQTNMSQGCMPDGRLLLLSLICLQPPFHA